MIELKPFAKPLSHSSHKKLHFNLNINVHEVPSPVIVPCLNVLLETETALYKSSASLYPASSFIRNNINDLMSNYDKI